MGADLLGRILFVCHPSLAQIYHEGIIENLPRYDQRSGAIEVSPLLKKKNRVRKEKNC
jgi:hypothetical protein